MKKVAFRAIDKNGREVTEYISATSNKHALAKLKREGFKEIEFLSDIMFSNREILEKLDDKTLNTLAKFEAQSLKKPTVYNSILQFLTINKTFLTIAIFLITVGVILPSKIAAVSGFLLLAFNVVVWLYSYRTTKLFEKILREITFGNEIEALTLIKKLQKIISNEKVISQLNFYKAKILASKGHINYALAILEEGKEQFKESAPGIYEHNKAMIYYEAKDYENCLNELQNAYNENPGSMTAIDLAMFNSEFGDVRYANIMLKSVVLEELPKYGEINYYFTLGNIAYSHKNLEVAEKYYQKMMQAIEAYAENPVFWIAIAICIGYYAVLLYDLNKKEEALEMLKDGTVKILNSHANDFLKADLHKRFPELIGK